MDLHGPAFYFEVQILNESPESLILLGVNFEPQTESVESKHVDQLVVSGDAICSVDEELVGGPFQCRSH